MRYFITNVLPHHLSGKYKISYAAANFSCCLLYTSTDRYDGCIIRDNDLDASAVCMEELMRNRKERERIAQNGIESCKRFETDKIIVQWVKLIESL